MAKQFLKKNLKAIFNYDNFKSHQEDIIQNVIDRKDNLVVMPTGSGKSLCYQLPAVLMEGTAIVISPLIALMKDQVDFLSSTNIKAVFISSSLSKKQKYQIHEDLRKNKIKLLYLAPELFTKEDTINFLKKISISFIAIDEAHCISEWGHNFRPEYRNIKTAIEQIKRVPIIALTASATPKVEKDIITNLEISNCKIFKTSFCRKNLYYEVRPKIDEQKFLVQYIKANSGLDGIIYCHNRKTSEEISEFLNLNSIKSLPYHAGLDIKQRIENQEKFLSGKINVIVATIAFGMGIDKSNIRYIIHYNIPKSIENYYQETGRAGRDGSLSECIMLFDSQDITKLEKLNKFQPIYEKLNSKFLMEEMKIFCLFPICRRKQMLFYFGEVIENDCNKCDNCLYPCNKFEANKYVTLVLDIISNLNKYYEEVDIVKYLIEDSSSKIYLDNTKLQRYGAEKNLDDSIFWKNIIRQALFFGFVSKKEDSTLYIEKNGIAFLEKPYKIYFRHLRNYDIKNTKTNFYNNYLIKNNSALKNKLLQKLHEARLHIAKNINLKPNTIIDDNILNKIIDILPYDTDILENIDGIDIKKVEQYGEKFLEIINEYVSVIVKSEPTIIYKAENQKQKSNVYIIKQIDRQINLEDIASSKSMSLEELLEKIEEICHSGIKLNINYFIDKYLIKSSQEELLSYFDEMKTENFNQAFEELKHDYDEIEVRLMYIKYLSAKKQIKNKNIVYATN